MTQRAIALAIFVGTMWIVRAIDTVRGGMGEGIVPRRPEGLVGIVTAPFIHASWSHLIANTIPLLILGALVLLRGVGEFVTVTTICAVTAGLGSWLFGSFGHHVGASGIVFGYVGYLLFRAFFDRSLWSALITLVVVAMYGSALLISLVPSSGISWTAHFFGFVGGYAAARVLRTPDVD